MLFPGAPQSCVPLVAPTGIHQRKNAAYAFPAFRGWVADSPTILPAAHSTGERFRFPVQTNAADGGTRPELSNPTFESRSCSVSSALPRIAFQRVKGVRRAFQRGRDRIDVTSRRRVRLKLNCISRGFHTRTRAADWNHRLQVSQTYSRNFINIATRCTHRQWQQVASEEEWRTYAEINEFCFQILQSSNS